MIASPVSPQRGGGFGKFLLRFDSFREIPSDLTEPTLLGSVFTLFGYFLCGTLFMCEMWGFLSAEHHTRIVMDGNQDKQLRINFDVLLHDLPCQHLTVGVWDSFGNERLNISSNIAKTRKMHDGTFHEYTEAELLSLDKKEFSAAEMEEYNKDWGSSTEKHTSFDNVIESHDFTFINFYAGWCTHCRNFAPEWDKFEKNTNEKPEELVDSAGQQLSVRVIKINCVDFEDTCNSQNIMGFPTVRLYKRSIQVKKQWKEYHGQRKADELIPWVKQELKSQQLRLPDVQFHDFFQEGCRAEGFVEVARVPGTLHFEASHSGETSLNFAFTNVSHTVNHLSFTTAGELSKYPTRVPRSFQEHVNILDGRTFLTSGFHQAPHHYIQVVSTFFEKEKSRSYQLTHQQRLAGVQKTATPQAKFSYQLSPVEVRVTTSGKKWYEFLTSLLAIVGGAFTVTGMLQASTAAAKRALKKGSLGKMV